MADRYKAIEVTAPGALRLVERPIPNPGPGQVRIRAEACGVCHEAAGAYARMMRGEARFRVVLTIGQQSPAAARYAQTRGANLY